MIDLHNHIVSGVDDGAVDMEESLAIARQFVSEGVTCIAATPHVNPMRGTGPGAAEVAERVEGIREALSAADIPLQVETGSEIMMTPEITDLLANGDVTPLAGGPAVLVEASFNDRPLYINEVIYRLSMAGYQPILAHPERYRWIATDLNLADDLTQRGATLQLTAPALLGEYGGQVRKVAETLLRRGHYGLAASDRHHPGPKRSLRDTYERITKIVDAPTAKLLLETNPRRVLDGQSIIPPPLGEDQPSLFSRFFGG